MFFKHFVHRTTRNQPVNLPSKCTSHFCTDKREITSNPFFEKYAEKIQRMQESTRLDCLFQLIFENNFVFQMFVHTHLSRIDFDSSNMCVLLFEYIVKHHHLHILLFGVSPKNSILQSSKSSSFLYQKVLEDEIAEFKEKSKKVKVSLAQFSRLCLILNSLVPSSVGM